MKTTNGLVNSRILNLQSSNSLYNIVNAINNEYLILNNDSKFVLNIGKLPNNQLPFLFGE